MRPAIDRVVLLVLCGCVLSFARTASADEPDMRQIQPFVMLIADTSGSMEWLPGCLRRLFQLFIERYVRAQ